MKDFIYLSIGTGLIYFSKFLVSLFTARTFNVAGLGELTAILLWPMIFSKLGDLGVSNSIIYYTSSEPENRDKIFSSSLVIFVVLVAIVDIVGFFLLPFLMASFSIDVIKLGQVYFLFCVPVTMLATNLSASVQGRGLFKQLSLLRPILDVLIAFEAAAFYFTKNSSLAYYLTLVLCTVSLNTLIFCGLALKEKWFLSYPDISIIKKLIGYGVRTYLGTITSMANLRLDQMIISVLLGPKLLGLYVAGVALSAICSIPSQIISLLGYQKISAKSGSDEKGNLIKLLFNSTVLLSAPTSVVMILLAPQIISFFYGEDYMGAVLPFRILLLGSFILAIKLQLEIAYKASNKPIIPSWAEVLSVFITVVGLSFSLSRFQIVGAAVTSALAYFFSFMFMLSITPAALKINLRTLFSPVSTFSEYLVRFKPSMEK